MTGGAIPYFGDAYMADTRHLTLEEHGAYHLLLLIAWRSPHCALPDNDKRIAQMLGVTAKKWAAIRPTIMAFWTPTENGWEQKRLTKERRWVEEKSRKNRDSAEARWEAKPLKTNKAADANASANASANGYANGYAPLPLPPPTVSVVANATTSRASFPMPVGCDPEYWRDFLANRKRKSLPNTPSAYKRMLNDIAIVGGKTGMDAAALIKLAAEKGWASINEPRESVNGQLGKSAAAYADLTRDLTDDDTF